jgi:hypothetical protein
MSVICLPDLTTDKDIRDRGAAYAAGYDDGRADRRSAWWLLQLAPVSDRELSDYWEGANRGAFERLHPRTRALATIGDKC